MRKKTLFARGLALAVALVVSSMPAAAAPAKRGKSKPKHPAPAASDSSTTPDTADKASPKPEDPAPPKADEAALAQPEPKPAAEAAPPTATKTVSEGDASLALGTSEASSADSEGTSKTDHEALGRQEAARLAAGRTEVGVSVSMDVASRRFAYNDELGSLLRPYKLSIAPMASFGLEAYPLASSDVPVLRDLGFRGRISRAFGLDSTTPEGDKIDTSWTRFSGEVRERLLVPGRHPLEFGVLVGADASYFVMSSTAKVQALLPSARTVSLRFGLDGRVLLAGRVSAMLGFAYLAVTSPGEIYERFRDPHVAGIDGDLGCAVAIIPGLEARLTGRYTRYFASFHPQVGDTTVAGGAVDQQLQAGLGVRYAH